MTTPRLESKRKPRRCPVCGFSPLASILWGMHPWSPKLEKDMAEGRIVLGGCCIEQDAPQWVCTRCRADIYKAGTDGLPPLPE